MKEWWLKGKDWWQSLAVREKQAVSIGGGVLAVFLIYSLIYAPLYTRIDSMRKQIVTSSKTLAWMQQADKQIADLSRSGVKAHSGETPVTVLSEIQTQLNTANLAQTLTQLKQITTDSISLQFKEVSFDKMISVLIALSRTHAVTVTQCTVIAANTPGMVDADIVVRLK